MQKCDHFDREPDCERLKLVQGVAMSDFLDSVVTRYEATAQDNESARQQETTIAVSRNA